MLTRGRRCELIPPRQSQLTRRQLRGDLGRDLFVRPAAKRLPRRRSFRQVSHWKTASTSRRRPGERGRRGPPFRQATASLTINPPEEDLRDDPSTGVAVGPIPCGACVPGQCERVAVVGYASPPCPPRHSLALWDVGDAVTASGGRPWRLTQSRVARQATSIVPVTWPGVDLVSSQNSCPGGWSAGAIRSFSSETLVS
jgi:hypothetical protein